MRIKVLAAELETSLKGKEPVEAIPTIQTSLQAQMNLMLRNAAESTLAQGCTSHGDNVPVLLRRSQRLAPRRLGNNCAKQCHEEAFGE